MLKTVKIKQRYCLNMFFKKTVFKMPEEIREMKVAAKNRKKSRHWGAEGSDCCNCNENNNSYINYCYCINFFRNNNNTNDLQLL